MAGADFLGDDLVLVESRANAEPIVHCLFATLKLNADSARALGVETWPCLGVTPKNKAVVAVRPQLRIVRSARIVALIVLDPPVVGRPHPAPMQGTEVLISIASTALPMACRTSTAASWLATVAALARQLPAYRLPVSWALDAFGTAVYEIIVQAAADQAKQRG
jgi:hypothetical protein